MPDLHDDIQKLIEASKDIAEFADFGDGVSREWIDKAEQRLGFKLPNSYKWWLENYGGGEVCGQEIFSIYEQDFDQVVGGDIVYMHELNGKQGLYPPNYLVICESDDDLFFFDLGKMSNDGEYPVYTGRPPEFYADNFLEFLRKRILYLRES